MKKSIKYQWVKEPPKKNGYYWVRITKENNEIVYGVTFIYWHNNIIRCPESNELIRSSYTNIYLYGHFNGTYNYRYSIDAPENAYHKKNDGIYKPNKTVELNIEYYTKQVKYVPDISEEEIRRL